MKEKEEKPKSILEDPKYPRWKKIIWVVCFMIGIMVAMDYLYSSAEAQVYLQTGFSNLVCNCEEINCERES